MYKFWTCQRHDEVLLDWRTLAFAGGSPNLLEERADPRALRPATHSTRRSYHRTAPSFDTIPVASRAADEAWRIAAHCGWSRIG